MNRYYWLAFLFAIGMLQQRSTVAAEPSLMVGAFSEGLIAGWERKAFKGETIYSLVHDAEKKSTVLGAQSNVAASGHYRKIAVDLVKTPFLNWSWKVSEAIAGADENAESDDDFSARIYVVVERGIVGSGSLPVSYVWATSIRLVAPGPARSQTMSGFWQWTPA